MYIPTMNNQINNLAGYKNLWFDLTPKMNPENFSSTFFIVGFLNFDFKF